MLIILPDTLSGQYSSAVGQGKAFMTTKPSTEFRPPRVTNWQTIGCQLAFPFLVKVLALLIECSHVRVALIVLAATMCLLQMRVQIVSTREDLATGLPTGLYPTWKSGILLVYSLFVPLFMLLSSETLGLAVFVNTAGNAAREDVLWYHGFAV